MKIKQLLLFPFIFGVLLVSCGNTQQKEEINIQQPVKKEINSSQTYQLLQKDKNIIVIDVRTPAEFNLGHIERAININVASKDFAKKINQLTPKEKTYLVYCRTKNRSNVAVKYMLKNGFTNVYQMVDGFSGWSRNNLPYTK